MPQRSSQINPASNQANHKHPIVLLIDACHPSIIYVSFPITFIAFSLFVYNPYNTF